MQKDFNNVLNIILHHDQLLFPYSMSYINNLAMKPYLLLAIMFDEIKVNKFDSNSYTPNLFFIL